MAIVIKQERSSEVAITGWTDIVSIEQSWVTICVDYDSIPALIEALKQTMEDKTNG